MKCIMSFAVAVSIAAMSAFAGPYCGVEELPDLIKCLPPPPEPGSADFARDVARYEWGKEQRKNPERAALARHDSVWSYATIADAFSKPFGMELSPTNMPSAWKLLEDSLSTTDQMRVAPKAFYHRRRPFAYFNEEPLCPKEDGAWRDEGSYPSGHTMRSMVAALILAEINPARCNEIFARAMQYGENRVIAGAHWQSDVDMTRIAAAIAYSRLQTMPAFRSQMERAKEEFATRANGHPAGFSPPGAPAAGPGYDTLIAHRGESMDAPENTLPAYRMAVERGFGFECDIYLSKDGRVFTFHDRDLKRTTGGANKKKCSDAMWKGELEMIDVGSWGKWKNSKFAGTRPALLEEVLALARDGRRIYIEVKTGPEIVPAVKEVFEGQSKATPKNALFITFNEATCKALKAAMPEYKVHWLVSPKKGTAFATADGVIAKLKELGVDGVDCHYKPDIVTAEFVKAVRDAGFEFHVWTVDALADAVEAFNRGAQTVTTNCAKKLLDELENSSSTRTSGPVD